MNTADEAVVYDAIATTRSQAYLCPPGRYVTTVERLAKHLGWTQKRVITALRGLFESGEVSNDRGYRPTMSDSTYKAMRSFVRTAETK